MTLDLTKIVADVGGMVARLKDGNQERQEHLKCALGVLCDKNINFERLKNRIIAARTTFPVAGVVDGLEKRYSAPTLPAEFTVLAADGSHIDVDRHRSTRLFLINIGAVVLRYGANPAAMLDSFPRLYSDEKDLVITGNGGKRREQPIEGALLDARRSVEECRKLAELASGLPAGSTALAVMDGSLVLWGLGTFTEEFIVEALLDKGFLVHLEEIRKLNKDRKLALASYISFPRNANVVDVLKVALCPGEPVNCERCPAEKAPDCEAVSGINDRMLFSSLLAPGERSELFYIQSDLIEKHYGLNKVYFFYLRVDDEIARVEVPEWVAMNKDLLGLTHALVLDQCKRGQGYPVALSEAHEQAVVTGADREQFWQLVESTLVEEHIPSITSGKSQSKRTRWI